VILISSICPECESNNLFYDNIRSETSCQTCGLVLHAHYDYVAGFKVYYPYREVEPINEEETPLTILQALIRNWRKWLNV